MKKVFCILVSAGIVFFAITLCTSKSLNAEIKSVDEIAPSDGVQGYKSGAIKCPGSHYVYRCFEGGSGCDVHAQGLC